MFPSHRGDEAIWLFSGGTTGRPKAVLQTHASFVNTTELYGKGAMGYTSADITLSVPKLYLGYATVANLLVPFSVRPGTLGKAVPGFEVKVCDDDGNELPDGEVGWLWVRGGAGRLEGDRLLARNGEDGAGLPRRMVCLGRYAPARGLL